MKERIRNFVEPLANGPGTLLMWTIFFVFIIGEYRWAGLVAVSLSVPIGLMVYSLARPFLRRLSGNTTPPPTLGSA